MTDETGEVYAAEEHGGQWETRTVWQDAVRPVGAVVSLAGDPETTLRRIDPLWQWLLRTRTGLLQADGQGFYDPAGLVLALE